MEHQTLTKAPEEHECSPTQTLAVLQVLKVIKSFTCNQDVSEEILVVKVELHFATCSRAARVFYWRMRADISSHHVAVLCLENSAPHSALLMPAMAKHPNDQQGETTARRGQMSLLNLNTASRTACGKGVSASLDYAYLPKKLCSACNAELSDGAY